MASTVPLFQTPRHATRSLGSNHRAWRCPTVKSKYMRSQQTSRVRPGSNGSLGRPHMQRLYPFLRMSRASTSKEAKSHLSRMVTKRLSLKRHMSSHWLTTSWYRTCRTASSTSNTKREGGWLTSLLTSLYHRGIPQRMPSVSKSRKYNEASRSRGMVVR